MLQTGAQEYEEHLGPTPLLMLSVNRENIKNINLNKIYFFSLISQAATQCEYSSML